MSAAHIIALKPSAQDAILLLIQIQFSMIWCHEHESKNEWKALQFLFQVIILFYSCRFCAFWE